MRQSPEPRPARRRPALWQRVLLIAALALAPAALSAETFGARVMAPGLLVDLAPGAAQSFQHSRLLPQADPSAPPPPGGYRRLEALEAARVSISATPEGKIALLQEGRTVAEFAKTTPHPVLLMFLENVMRSVAQETGGSPHYIRNRMRMTLGAEEVVGDSLRLRPFDDDPNRGRFGPFAGLELEIHWRPGAPGQLTELRASLPDAPERYSETFRADPME